MLRYLAQAAAPWVCLFRDKEGMLPLDWAKERKRDGDIVEFMTKVTNAAARVLIDTLLFKGKTLLPRDMCGHVAAFTHDGPEEVAILKLLLAKNEVHCLLQRDEMRSKIREQTLNAIADE
jgi:hypothetical protein